VGGSTRRVKFWKIGISSSGIFEAESELIFSDSIKEPINWALSSPVLTNMSRATVRVLLVSIMTFSTLGRLSTGITVVSVGIVSAVSRLLIVISALTTASAPRLLSSPTMAIAFDSKVILSSDSKLRVLDKLSI